MSKYLYVPTQEVSDYITEAAKHEGHTIYADMPNGYGYYKPQLFGVQAVRMASNQVYLSSKFGSAWVPVAELWARQSPQCMTCKD